MSRQTTEASVWDRLLWPPSIDWKNQMHELSIAMSIVEAAQDEAGRHGGAQVSAVHLKLGMLSGVAKEALLFSYELACQDTPLAGSKLIIDEVPVVIYCRKCEERRPLRSIQHFCCPVCETPSAEVVLGKELEVVGLEIEQ
jgi:hydrogenase nickel incorporation protein HypA/HybF